MAQKQWEPPQKMILPGTTIGGDVGTFHADFTLWNPGRTRSRALSGLVDTGASYTLVPASTLDDLGIERRRVRTFRLADGSTRDFSIGLVEMELQGTTESVHVVFGAEDSRALLGAMALEAFALAADAKNRCLIPAELTL